MSRKKVYYNQKQIEAITLGTKSSMIVAARGFGKSEGIDAPLLIRDITTMPGATIPLLSPTYKKLLQNTLPAVEVGLNRIGYYEGIHYVMGRRADPKLNFAKPIYEPRDWSYFMHWYNGTVCQFSSFDVAMSLNSKSVDAVHGFEAKFLDKSKIDNEVSPANRGNLNKWNVPWHHGMHFSTDMPTSKTGEWVFEYEKMMDESLISYIKELMVEQHRIRTDKTLSPKYVERRNYELSRELFACRKNAVLYREFSALDNIDILGEQFIKDQKRVLPPMIFQASILNRRFKKVLGGFYASFNEDVHVYESSFSSLQGRYGLDYKGFRNDCTSDEDLDENLPLVITFDYNGNINNLVVAQHTESWHRTRHTFYTKYEQKLRELCRIFCDYYAPRHNRDVVYYYDSTAIKSAYAVEDAEAFSDVVVNELTARGFKVNAVYIGQQMKHAEKHQIFDDAFKGLKYLFPSVHKYNCEELILAMQAAGIRIGRNGFEKDKSGEKKEETADDPLQTRTDVTDAWDTNFIGCTFYPQAGMGSDFVSEFLQ